MLFRCIPITYLLFLLSIAPIEQTPKGVWVPISDALLAKLTAEGNKPGFPGGTAGVNVDRETAELRIIVPNQGIWRRMAPSDSLTRMDGGSVSGRCETGFGLNSDPSGKRLACFMLDGKSAMTLDNGRSWRSFQQLGRGWDYGTVDWSGPNPQTMLAVHHESGCDLHLSEDAGKSWKLLGKDYTAIGIFAPKILVASKGDGILRSTNSGVSWTKVSDRTPTGRVLSVFKGIGYWVTKEGLLISRDKGISWKAQGRTLEAAWGPFFGKDEKQIVVVGRDGSQTGLFQSLDAGQSWKFAAPLPDLGKSGRDRKSVV